MEMNNPSILIYLSPTTISSNLFSPIIFSINLFSMISTFSFVFSSSSKFLSCFSISVLKITYTFCTISDKYKASSRASLFSPNTATSFFLKNAPSQVAQ